ncbi:hypothetical protein MHU86_24535 [Fragilaria crotonensis]|nr:hypothetical protein MHU86_24535 [Fragilaria crotonensis]
MTQSNNVFLTSENLAFSLPLLTVCGAYAYFNYIPLYIGGPILVGVGLVFLVKSQMKALKNKKLQNLDEDFIKDLAGDTEEEAKAKQEAEAAKARKAKAKLEQRLAIEQKKLRQMNGEKKKKKKKGADNDDEDEALEMFIKKKTK